MSDTSRYPQPLAMVVHALSLAKLALEKEPGLATFGRSKVEKFYATYKTFPEIAGIPTSPIYKMDAEKIAMAQQSLNMITEEINEELIPAIKAFMKAPSLENLVEVLDGGIDGIYVILQLFHQLDLPFEEAFMEVHANNLAKLQLDPACPDEIKILKREDGKILKPEGHPKPRLWEILLRHSNMRARETSEQGADNWNN